MLQSRKRPSLKTPKTGHLQKIVSLLKREKASLKLAVDPKVKTVAEYFTPDNIALVSDGLVTEEKTVVNYLKSWRLALTKPICIPERKPRPKLGHLRKIVAILRREKARLKLAVDPKVETFAEYFTPDNIAVVSACLATEQVRDVNYLKSWRSAVTERQCRR